MLVYSSIHIFRHRHTETCLYTQTREHTSFFEESRIQIHMNKYKCTPRTHTDARKETHKNIDTLTNRKAQMRVRVGCILVILFSLIILFSFFCCFGRTSVTRLSPLSRIGVQVPTCGSELVHESSRHRWKQCQLNKWVSTPPVVWKTLKDSMKRNAP